MALIENFELPAGLSVKTAYHKIVKAEIDYVANVATFLVNIYVSKTDRDENRPPLYVRKIVINKVDDTLGLRDKLYKYMKTTTDYQESKDI